MNYEWEIIAADEKDVLDEKVQCFVKNNCESYGEETHYSVANFQWESLITYVPKEEDAE